MTSQRSWTITKTITTDTNAYASGDNVGGLITLENALDSGYKTGAMVTAIIGDLDKQAADFDIIIFDANPSATTFTNNVALDIADVDLNKITAIIQVGTSVNFVDNEVVYNAVHLGSPVKTTDPDGDLWAAIVVRSTPTFSSTSALSLKLQLTQDIPN